MERATADTTEVAERAEEVSAPTRAPANPPVMAPRWPLLLFRALATCEALLALDQAALAGGFLAGHYGALDMHAAGATATGVAAILQTLAAVLLWRPGRGPGWPAAAGCLLVGAIAAQITMGYDHTLAVHVPLGAAILVCTVLMVVWSWRATPGEAA